MARGGARSYQEMYNQNILSQAGQGLLRQAASTKGAASVFTASPSGATQSLRGLNTQAGTE